MCMGVHYNQLMMKHLNERIKELRIKLGESERSNEMYRELVLDLFAILADIQFKRLVDTEHGKLLILCGEKHKQAIDSLGLFDIKQ